MTNHQNCQPIITDSIQALTEITDELDLLCGIENILGYGEGKSSCTHIVDTPMKMKLLAWREEVKSSIRKKIANSTGKCGGDEYCICDCGKHKENGDY